MSSKREEMERIRNIETLPSRKMRSGVRWKKEGRAAALEEPISSLYKEMLEWEPVEALLVHRAVVLSIDSSKARILNRACFGNSIYAAAPSQGSATSAPTCSPTLSEEKTEPEDLRIYQLGLEEAFFLASEVGCISICRHIRKGREALCKEEVWRCMQTSRPEFWYRYIAYAHLRAKNWVVKFGIQYGADFMAYRHHPILVHSDYAVIVMVEGQEERVQTWTEVHAMDRLCRSVGKTLLLLHIIPKCERTDLSSPLCQGAFRVEAAEVRRWLPEKNREESDQSIQPLRNQAST